MRYVQRTEEREEELVEDGCFPVCETTLMPVFDEYKYVDHPVMRIGSFKYIEGAP